LPSEHAVEEDVVRRLKILGAKGAGRVTIDATFLEEISRPAALLECKSKNLHLAGSFAC
jgi:hypothetical protein